MNKKSQKAIRMEISPLRWYIYWGVMLTMLVTIAFEFDSRAGQSWAIPGNPIATRLLAEHQLNTANLNPGFLHLSQLWNQVHSHTEILSLKNLFHTHKKTIFILRPATPPPPLADTLELKRRDRFLLGGQKTQLWNPNPWKIQPTQVHFYASQVPSLHFLRVVSKMSINYNCDWRRSRAELRYLNCNLLSALPISIQIVENCNHFWNQTLRFCRYSLHDEKCESQWMDWKNTFLSLS